MLTLHCALFLLLAVLAEAQPPWWGNYNPVADPEAVVTMDKARFTVLADGLLRLEMSDSSPPTFNDHATLVVINRRTVVPKFTQKKTSTTLSLQTSLLKLDYDSSKQDDGVQFSPESLQVSFELNGKTVSWEPGTKDTGNLFGTRTSLDCYKPNCFGDGLQPGLLSRDGWVVWDDSTTPLYDTSSWPWINTTRSKGQDLYFFGYGHNYRQCLQHFTEIAGKVTLPPPSAFGLWWSRYYAYSQKQFIDEVLSGYHENDLPLNHVVLDMDWHIEPKEKGCASWGGYTWNTDLWPQHEQFIESLHSGTSVVGWPLKLLLNVHPQTGVDHCQTAYPKMANDMGVNPSSKETVACAYTNKTYVSSLYKDVLPGVGAVDFWWTDYDGCGNGGRWNLFWTNYVSDTQLIASNKRPLVLSRYGGTGQHRYGIGFSGDTHCTFEHLEYEVNITKIAANILFGYWSHDIGGFNGNPSDELYLRWIQFGAVAPIFRSHTNHGERRIWKYASFDLMKEAFYLRNALGPYLYTAAYHTSLTGVSAIHPLYYDFPEVEEAYAYKYQYMFGESLLAAPITTPVDTTNRTEKAIWLPEGEWLEWKTSTVMQGPKVIQGSFGLADLPLYAKAGSVIPTKTMASVAKVSPDPLVWVIFLGSNAQGEGFFYEDDGATMEYVTLEKSAMTSLRFTHDVGKGTIAATVANTVGSYEGMPSKRGYVIQIRGMSGSVSSVSCAGKTIPQGQTVPGWYIEEKSSLLTPAGTLVISLGEFEFSVKEIDVMIASH